MSPKINRSMNIPNNLIQKIQGDYVASKYQDGVFTFQNLDTSTIEIVIKSMLSWSEDNNFVKGNCLDLSFIGRNK